MKTYKRKTVSLRLTEENNKKLEDLSSSYEVSKSDMINTIIHITNDFILSNSDYLKDIEFSELIEEMIDLKKEKNLIKTITEMKNYINSVDEETLLSKYNSLKEILEHKKG